MRWSEWRLRPPVKEAATPRVLGAVDAVLGTLGADLDGECWVVWGEDAIIKWSLVMPTPPGLVALTVRPVSQDGPRVSGKLVRWPRVQIGEFAVDLQQGHRIVALSVEGIVLRGVDADADAIGEFLQNLYAAIDGRVGVAPVVADPGRRRVARGKASKREGAPELEKVAVAALPEPVRDDDNDPLPDFLAQLASADDARAALPSGLPLLVDEDPAPPQREERITFSSPAPLPVARPPVLEQPVGPLGRRLAAGVPPTTADPGRRPGQTGSGR